MKNDVHLVYSDSPIPEGVNVQAICGKIVHNAKIACMWDEQKMGSPLDIRPSGLCRNCYLCPSPPEEGKSIVYGFTEGPAVLPAEFREALPNET